MRSRLLFLSSVFASLLFAQAAYADALPPDANACSAKKAGDACTVDDGAAGVCTSSTCSKIQYLPDGGQGTATYACLKCSPASCGGGADIPCTGKAVDDACTFEGKTGKCAPLNCKDALACETTAGDRAFGDNVPAPVGIPDKDDDKGATPSSSAGGCAIGAGDVGSSLVLLGLVIPLVPLARRRRRKP